jgi:hypothetical protein
MNTAHHLDPRHDGWKAHGLEPQRQDSGELLLDLPAAYDVKEGDTLVLTEDGQKRSYSITRVLPSDDGRTVSLMVIDQ